MLVALLSSAEFIEDGLTAGGRDAVSYRTVSYIYIKIQRNVFFVITGANRSIGDSK